MPLVKCLSRSAGLAQSATILTGDTATAWPASGFKTYARDDLARSGTKHLQGHVYSTMLAAQVRSLAVAAAGEGALYQARDPRAAANATMTPNSSMPATFRARLVGVKRVTFPTAESGTTTNSIVKKIAPP